MAEYTDRLPYELEHIFSFRLLFGINIDMLGPVPGGLQAHELAAGGEVWGPKFTGKLRPTGGDWFMLRQDGVGQVDARLTIETNDGSLIYMPMTGVSDLGADGFTRVTQQGAFPDFIPFHVAVRFLTGSPDYQWLNRIQGVGVGINREHIPFPRDREQPLDFDIYAVRSFPV
ncbi:MAG: DUF3237 domain-containing protein [Chloroflexaceae bacterium]